MRVRPKTAAAFLLLAVLAAPLFGVTLEDKLKGVFVPGADQFGNPSYINGSQGRGKIYKDTRTGIITVEAKADVTNPTGSSVRFLDLGFVIYDPWGKRYHTSDRDRTVLERPKRGTSAGSVTAVVVP